MEVHLSRIAKAKLENFGSEVSKEKGLYYYIPQALMMRTSHSSPEHPRLQSLQKKQMTRVFHNKAINRGVDSQYQETKGEPEKNARHVQRPHHPDFWKIKEEMDKVNMKGTQQDKKVETQRALHLQITNLKDQLAVQEQSNKDCYQKALTQMDSLKKDNIMLQKQHAIQSNVISQLESKIKHLLSTKEKLEKEQDREIKARYLDKKYDTKVINKLGLKVSALTHQIKTLLITEQDFLDTIEDFQKNQAILESTICSQDNQMQAQKAQNQDLQDHMYNLRKELEFCRKQKRKSTTHTITEENHDTTEEISTTENQTRITQGTMSQPHQTIKTMK